MASISSMTIHKYLSILHGIQFGEWHIYLAIFVSWIFPSLLVFTFYFTIGDTSTLVGVQASGDYCAIAMGSPKTANITAALLILVYILFTFFVLVFCHAQIVVTYHRLNQRKEKKELALRKMHIDNRQKEWKLILKSILISGSFIFVWIFYVILILYEVINQKAVDVRYDAFIQTIISLSPIINIIILYHYDAKFKLNIIDLFPIQWIRYLTLCFNRKRRAEDSRNNALGQGGIAMPDLQNRLSITQTDKITVKMHAAGIHGQEYLAEDMDTVDE